VHSLTANLSPLPPAHTARAYRQAEKEERERRRAEALNARRYPIDDAELLCELAAKAASALGAGAALAMAATPEAAAPSKAAKGKKAAPKKAARASEDDDDAAAAGRSDGGAEAAEAAPAFDPVAGVLAGARQLPAEEGRALGDLLYVADFVTSFAKPLKIKGVSGGAEGLMAALTAAAGGAKGEAAGAAQQWVESIYHGLLMVRGGCGRFAPGCAALYSPAPSPQTPHLILLISQLSTRPPQKNPARHQGPGGAKLPGGPPGRPLVRGADAGRHVARGAAALRLLAARHV
jgi:hypothetical protein